MTLVKVAPDKRHLLDSTGRPFFMLGVNYAGYFDRAWKMWEPDLFDPNLITLDFRKAQNSGLNALRLFAHRPLIEQIRKNDFSRLDQTLSIAQDHKLLVLFTLNDAHDLNLAQVAELDAKIAKRYEGISTILGFDLENEPVFYTLAAAIYPTSIPAPIQTSQLVDHYGVRVSRAEAADLQRQQRIPGHLDADKAFYYINGLRLFLEYDAAVSSFVRQGKGNLIDFMLSDEAAPWHPLITVLDGTVAAWLRARMEPIRAADSQRLLTVGWNWLHFAALPANRALDFQEYHNYPSLNRVGFNANISHLDGLRRAFPNQPVVFGEFGWSNQSGSDMATSQSVHPALTTLYEGATYIYLRTNGFAGGFKWMLNDVQDVSNPREANFGMFAVGDQPKRIRDLIERFSRDWPSVDQPGKFTILNDVGAGISYQYELPNLIEIGGYIYQDEKISWRGQGVAHCFIKIANQELIIDTHSGGRLSVDPWDIIPTWNRASEANLFRAYANGQRTRLHSYVAGQSVEFDVSPGIQYVVAIGAETPVTPPPENAPQFDPKPGEHVLVLADSDQYLQAALTYIRRFTPDFTFAANEVEGRWAYVTVIASPEQVSDELLDDIRGRGAQLVERVAGATIEATKEILDEMAHRGQRFLTAIVPLPPQEEPPLGELVVPPDDHGETYIVQPGDTLSKIASQLYGDGRLWTAIYEANRDKISNPNLVRVGLELRIPVRA